MKNLSLRSLTTVLIVVCAVLIVVGTIWLGTRELSVEQVYNVAISTLVIIISVVCVASLVLFGRGKRK